MIIISQTIIKTQNTESTWKLATINREAHSSPKDTIKNLKNYSESERITLLEWRIFKRREVGDVGQAIEYD
jgi:hypothetical protein